MRYLIFIALMLTTACAYSAHQPQNAIADLSIEKCELGPNKISADCGRMLVYENRSEMTGRIIPVEFVRAPAGGGAEDVVIFLSGGPGQNAVRSAGRTLALGNKITGHDVLIINPRGVDGDTPLDCVYYDLENHPEQFAQIFEQAGFDPERMQACANRLQKFVDLRQYTTSNTADDFNDLREALGYKSMTLSGVSYGTTLALEIMRRHQDVVRAAVLIGPAPSSALQTETIASDMEAQLQKLFNDCRADDACHAAYPNFENDFHAVLNHVRENPVSVEFPHLTTNEPVAITVEYGELTTAIRYALYRSSTAALLPSAIDKASSGDFLPLIGFLPQLVYRLSNGLNEGLWASVRCAEEFPFIDQARAKKMSAGTIFGEERLISGNAICAIWPRGKTPANFHDPVVSDIPTLLIGGSLDMATPPWMLEEIKRHLTNAKAAILPNRAHSDLVGDPCTGAMLIEFIADPEQATPNEACYRNYARPPFKIE